MLLRIPLNRSLNRSHTDENLEPKTAALALANSAAKPRLATPVAKNPSTAYLHHHKPEPPKIISCD